MEDGSLCLLPLAAPLLVRRQAAEVPLSPLPRCGDGECHWGAEWSFQLQSEALFIGRLLAFRNTIFEP